MNGLARRVIKLEARYPPAGECPECHGDGLVAISTGEIPDAPPNCPTCGHPPRLWRQYPGVDWEQV